MTPKEKAQELVDKFIQYTDTSEWTNIEYVYAKQCALIAVDEILKVIEVIPNVRYRYVEEGIWLSIKSEIEAL
jgi:hypothetical protein